MRVELSEKEAKLLLDLLEEHLYYGWIYRVGEFDLEASGEVSPTLKKLYYRLKGAQPPRGNAWGTRTTGT